MILSKKKCTIVGKIRIIIMIEKAFLTTICCYIFDCMYISTVSDLNKNSKLSFICTFNIINNGKYLQNQNVKLSTTLKKSVFIQTVYKIQEQLQPNN